VTDFLRAFAKECVNKGFSGHSNLKEYENKGVAKSTFRNRANEYQNKGLKRFCPHCGVGGLAERIGWGRVFPQMDVWPRLALGSSQRINGCGSVGSLFRFGNPLA
jgi:hypothetical protein